MSPGGLTLRKRPKRAGSAQGWLPRERWPADVRALKAEDGVAGRLGRQCSRGLKCGAGQ